MHDPAATPPLSTLPPPVSDATQEVPALSGIRYGRFALQRFHAKGGLGEVHVAVDGELGREVALKRIQEQYATNEAAQRRFLNEAEITAQLEHPGVVPIHGLVHDDQGQPCYAMRFIAGESLAEAIKKWHETARDYAALPFRQLLQRFISVCQTMAYAHSKQIIHRDLKPANVMLGPYGETLVVDWGLAKRVVKDQQSERKEETGILTAAVDFRGGSTEDRVYTQAGQVLGTAGYMSPEQAAGNLDEVGPASDIYSLGATLYELLTGRRPLSDSDIFAILQKTQSGDIAAPRQGQPAVPKALEAICLRAMALKPGARYASAAALAADLEHWLADQPVNAWPDPLSVRLRRWLSRHRLIVVAAVVLILTGVVALAVGLIAVDRERQRTERARADETVARRQTRAALDEMSSEVIEEWLAKQQQLTKQQQRFLAKALAYYEEFSRQHGAEEESRAGVASAHFRVGKIHRRLGHVQEAETAFRHAINLYQELARVFSNQSAHRHNLGACANELGAMLVDNGRLQEAETILRDSLEGRQQLSADYPANAEYRFELAQTYKALGDLFWDLDKFTDAERSYQQALQWMDALIARFPAEQKYRLKMGGTANNLGGLYYVHRRPVEAERTYLQAAALYETLVREAPSVDEYRSALSGTLCNIATLFTHYNRAQEAEAPYLRALEIQKQLVVEFPLIPVYRLKLAVSHNNLGILYKDLGKYPQAENAYRDALVIQERLVADFPTIYDYRNNLAGTLGNLGELCLLRKDYQGACGWIDQAIPHHERALQAKAQHPEYLGFFRSNLRVKAAAFLELGDYRMATSLLDRLLGLQPDATDFFKVAGLLARCGRGAAKDAHLALAQRQQLEGDYHDRAIAALRQAVVKGYTDSEQLKTVEDFKSLHQRADFQKLLQEMEKPKP